MAKATGVVSISFVEMNDKRWKSASLPHCDACMILRSLYYGRSHGAIGNSSTGACEDAEGIHAIEE
jgi:hypothetical protein